MILSMPTVYTLDTALGLLDRQTLENGRLYYLVTWDTRLGAMTQLHNAASGQAKSFGSFNHTGIAMKYMVPAADALNCNCFAIEIDNRFGTKLDLPPKAVPTPLPSHGIEVHVKLAPFGEDYYNVSLFNRAKDKVVRTFCPGTQKGKDDARKAAETLSNLLNAPVLWV